MNTFCNLGKTNWLKWSEIALTSEYNKRGIYFIAKFDSTVPNFDFIHKEIIYIGETKRNEGFKSRLNEFKRCATTLSTGHPGGIGLRREFINQNIKSSSSWNIPSWCHVALISIPENVDKIFACNILKQYESFFLSLYYETWGAPPMLNREVSI